MDITTSFLCLLGVVLLGPAITQFLLIITFKNQMSDTFKNQISELRFLLMIGALWGLWVIDWLLFCYFFTEHPDAFALFSGMFAVSLMVASYRASVLYADELESKRERKALAKSLALAEQYRTTIPSWTGVGRDQHLPS